MTAIALIVYALVALGVARAEADRRSAWNQRGRWFAALAIGAIWPLALLVAFSSKAWTVAGEWL